MRDRKLLFQTYSDARLIEVVKNAKQFGYDESIRCLALEVLKERGITEDDLALTGNLTNSKFDYSQEVFYSYNTASKTAFIAYFVGLCMRAIDVFNLFGIDHPGLIFQLVFGLVIVSFLIALTKSFFDHLNFYKSIGKDPGTGDQLIFFLLGMPFYIVMYFFYRSRMKEELLMIN